MGSLFSRVFFENGKSIAVYFFLPMTGDMYARLNMQGLWITLDIYRWLGRPSAADVVFNEFDLLVVPGRFLLGRPHQRNTVWFFTTGLLPLVIPGKQEVSLEEFGGRRVCRLIKCMAEFYQGYTKYEHRTHRPAFR